MLTCVIWKDLVKINFVEFMLGGLSQKHENDFGVSLNIEENHEYLRRNGQSRKLENTDFQPVV